MTKKKDIIILIIGIVAVVGGFFYLDTSGSLFGLLTSDITPVNWDEVRPREIVKNSIPIILIETNGNTCKVTAEKFDYIVNHPYFIRGDELAKQLQYDKENRTLILPCDILQGEKSRLNVWYVVEESPKHALKYEYFVTKWDEQQK